MKSQTPIAYDDALLAVVERSPDSLRALLVRKGASPSVAEARVFGAGDWSGLHQWLDANRCNDLRLVLPTAAVLVRTVVLPQTSQTQMLAALALQAEGFFLGSVPQHRLALAVGPQGSGGADGERQGFILAWPNAQAAGATATAGASAASVGDLPPRLESIARYIPEPAALLPLASGDLPALVADRRDGSIAIAMRSAANPGRLVVRATREESTGESWNGIMHDCMITKDCVYYQDPATGDVTYYNQEDSFWQDLDEDTYTNQCTPHPVGTIIFFCFFCILCAFVMLNLVIAVILDNFQNNSKTSELGVSKEDMMHFTDVWMRLDPRATYYIPAEKLPRVIGAMDHPVGTRGLSKHEAKTKCMHVIMTVDIPNHDGKIHFLETLHALTGRIAGTELPESEEVKVRDSMVDRLPTFDNAKDVPKFTAAHFHAALYVQAAVRGYMQRYRIREKLKQAETRAEEKREAAEARKAGK